MATATRKKKTKPKETWHGANGYSNRGCRCEICKEGWAAYIADYRNRRFTGTACSTPRCKNNAAPNAGNGLCYSCNLEHQHG